MIGRFLDAVSETWPHSLRCGDTNGCDGSPCVILLIANGFVLYVGLTAVVKTFVRFLPALDCDITKNG